MLGGQLASQEGGGSCGVAMTSRNQSVSSSRPGLQAGRCSRQTSKSRREQRSSVSMRLLALALVLIVGQSEGASLRSNVLELEDDHESLLTRAKDLFTDAVHDAANAVKPAAKRWSNQKISLHASKKPAAGGVPSWFTGASLERKTHSGQLQGNRRMLRRQKAHHHSVEDEWLKCHRRYVEELEGNEASTSAWDVLFYGDSIMEEWRGTFLGSAWGPFQDVKKVWAEHFNSKPYKSHALGIAGDKAEQLLWRLQNGELPATKHPKVVVVMIGTNDLVGNCTLQTAQETAQAILKVNTLLHAELPGAHLLSLAVLPKGEMWPNRCTDAILAVNAELQEYAEQNSDFAHFHDLGSAFLSTEAVGGKYEVKEALMPDSLHPSAVGMRIVATQLEPIISSLVSRPLSAELDEPATA